MSQESKGGSNFFWNTLRLQQLLLKSGQMTQAKDAHLALAGSFRPLVMRGNVIGTLHVVVRNVCLYYPILFRSLAKKRSKTAKFLRKILCHQRCHRFVTAPFLEQKSLKTENSEKCVFRVRRQMCCLGLQIRSFSAENRRQVFAVLRNPFSTPKSLRIPAR